MARMHMCGEKLKLHITENRPNVPQEQVDGNISFIFIMLFFILQFKFKCYNKYFSIFHVNDV